MAEGSAVREMGESWLCLVTEGKIFGITLSKLLKSEGNMTCIPTPNFDFCLDLPTPGLCPFVFDSNIYMASESLDPNWVYDHKSDLPPNQIYEFRIDSKKKRKHQQQHPEETLPQPLISLSKSFPPAPVPFMQSYLTTILGDVYVYVDPTRQMYRPETIHVLCSSSKEWKPLPFPPLPPPRIGKIRSICASGMFVLDDKLFLPSLVSENSLFSFNPKSQSWTVEHEREPNNVSLFCHLGVSDMTQVALPYLTVVLKGPSCDYNVALSFTFHDAIRKLGSPRNCLINLCALLVNPNGGVILYQLLDQCFEGIQPTMEYAETLRFSIVDLGNSKLCAVVFARANEYDHNHVLFISVFTLSVVKDLAAFHTHIGSPPSSSMKQTFLSVTVHSKNVYNVKHWHPYNDLLHTFVWPPLKDARFQQRTATF